MIEPELIADIDFDRPLPCLIEGWCAPEAQFSWTIGQQSRISLPCPPGTAPYTLIIQGHPYRHPPELCRQRLDVQVNGKVLASLEVDDLFTHRIRIPQGVIAKGRADIVFIQTATAPHATAPPTPAFSVFVSGASYCFE